MQIVTSEKMRMSLERDPLKCLISSGWDAIWNEGVLEAADSLMGEGYTRTVRDRQPRTLSDFKRSVLAVRHSFPDLVLEITDMVREGSEIVTRWTVSGTHTGAFLDTPATHLPVTISGVTWTVCERSRVVSEWLTWEPEDMLRVLGIISVEWEIGAS
jgi:steroid delta-isomerase-like uncharacterized protein